MVQLSIIIPVYKAAKYLRPCLDSIKMQDFSNWECIIVDDGSPDESGLISDQYAKFDSRFRVVHKENGGVSSARNTGIEFSTGKWLTFIDADDKLAPKTLSICMRVVQEDNLDILQFAYTNSESLDEDIEELSEIMNIDSFISSQKYSVSAWANIIKADIVKGNVRFDVEMKHGEDQKFFMQCISRSTTIRKIDSKFYFYRRTDSSATARANTKDLLMSFYKMLELREELPHFKRDIDGTLMYFTYGMINNRDMKISAIFKLFDDANIGVYENDSFSTRIFKSNHLIGTLYIRVLNRIISTKHKLLRK